jgi:hypothetical protein
VSNKPFYTKGLNRQLEEKASKELIELRKAHNELKESKKRDEIHLREQRQQLQQ